jgi:hypothetical protein
MSDVLSYAVNNLAVLAESHKVINKVKKLKLSPEVKATNGTECECRICDAVVSNEIACRCFRLGDTNEEKRKYFLRNFIA